MKRIAQSQNILHMTNREILEYSRLKAGLTNKQVAMGMALGEETIARYQREPQHGEHAYDLGIGKAELWCNVVGNILVAQWVDLRCRQTLKAPCETSLSEMVRRINKEAHDVVSALLEDKDGNGIPDEDPDSTLREILELQAVVDSAVAVALKKTSKVRV